MAREVRCWCYCAKKMVTVRGDVVGVRAAELLKIWDCLEANCRMRGRRALVAMDELKTLL